MTVVKINRLSVPEGVGPELEHRFAERKHSVDSAPGFQGFELLRPVGEQKEYYVITHWADESSFQNWASQRQARDPKTTVSTSEGMLEFEVVDLD
ncbi:antibiotic biosynthesis monooxygenase [Kocuria massiliensis]|uniref:antibiotic biosynthesis monooxygenase family protein n=1 Tax=Kocuria massiliensis TaxID=1926282 RepID=UPI000A1CD101|nr:antibiotic biosynthesis monooxygenase [Kocuria massiliensis]MCT1367455.1 antibiotic biosynthesis monooxygenase [Rothia sp. p3-SID1597]